GKNVLRYAGGDGHFLGVAASGFNGPLGLAFGPLGHLFVGAAVSNVVMRFNSSGTLIRTYTAGPSHSQAAGVAFDAQGRMYVAYSLTNEIWRFDPNTGANLGLFASGSGLNTPISMIFDHDGNLLVG